MQRFLSQGLSLFAIIGLFFSLTTPVLAEEGPLKVFILAGQSNMQGHAQVRTLSYLGQDEQTASMLKDIQNADGSAKLIDDVWISYLSANGKKHGQLTTGFGAADNKIGPELTFGIYASKGLKEPILIIKTAWGGKSLHTDFRPPSAGPYELNEAQIERLKRQGKDVEQAKRERREASGEYYRLMMNYVQSVLGDPAAVCPDYDVSKGYELAGFVWFQGWNDMVDSGVYPQRGQPGGYSLYSELLTQFVHDVRKDLNSPDLPFVIGVMGVNGPTSQYTPDQQRYKFVHQEFRDAMAAPAAMPELRNVVAVKTEDYWDLELSALRKREAAIRQQIRKLKNEKALGREAEQRELAKLMNANFSAEEQETLKNAISNAEYHYLGSAKILGQIGRAFAEAVIDVR